MSASLGPTEIVSRSSQFGSTRSVEEVARGAVTGAGRRRRPSGRTKPEKCGNGRGCGEKRATSRGEQSWQSSETVNRRAQPRECRGSCSRVLPRPGRSRQQRTEPPRRPSAEPPPPRRGCRSCLVKRIVDSPAAAAWSSALSSSAAISLKRRGAVSRSHLPGGCDRAWRVHRHARLDRADPKGDPAGIRYRVCPAVRRFR